MILLLIWIHGFKGTDNTFEDFPKRIAYSLSSSLSSTNVESLVYPAYRTAGALDEAVAMFTEWLISNVAEREEAALQESSKGKGTWKDREQARIVLMAHSMGGLVAADTFINLANTYAQTGVPPWPHIIGIIAYDSPMLGLNPALFSNTAQQYIDYASAAHDTISSLTGVGLGSLWGSKGGQAAQSTYQKKSQQDQSQVIPPVSAHQAAERDASAGSGGGPSWLTAKSAGAVGGSLAAAATAGLLWHQRSTISNLGVKSYGFVTDHLEFVGALWKVEELKKRLERITDAKSLDPNCRATFHCFYTTLPLVSTTQKVPPRTFITLPKTPAQVEHFEANQNSAAGNEVDAHVSMFSVKNDGGHQLALRTVARICEMVEGL